MLPRQARDKCRTTECKRLCSAGGSGEPRQVQLHRRLGRHHRARQIAGVHLREAQRFAPRRGVALPADAPGRRLGRVRRCVPCGAEKSAPF
jgi:hypothetical protein